MNWIICPVVNNPRLTREAIKSFRAQDIETGILIIDNDADEVTKRWLMTQDDLFVSVMSERRAVSYCWNRGLEWVFEQSDHALVVNNDVELRPDTYRHLLQDGGLFVTAVGVDHKNLGADDPDPAYRAPYPDFSCFMIRKEAWDKVGPFDENFLGAFGEDWDYHVRLERAGIKAACLALPFYHVASATLKSMDNMAEEAILKMAEGNREYFYRKHGVRGASREYLAIFGLDHGPEPPPPPRTLNFCKEKFDHAWEVSRVIPGTYSKQEAELLWKACSLSHFGILEVGAYFGRSTSVIAQFIRESRQVFDIVDGFVLDQAELVKASLLNMLHEIGAEYKLYESRTRDVDLPKGRLYDVIHIDGGHWEGQIAMDCHKLLGRVSANGVILFHDYGREGFESVRKVVDRYTEGWARTLNDTLLAVSKSEETINLLRTPGKPQQ